ncbi:glycosyltransferase family 4 protein [Bacteroides reticulotermitis]|uniref:glycosyltransferase family 4 protein n=1 Tax=Bacteroides reticulotermitis TaxID=1133319 RepID=UPI003A846232
MRAFFYIWIERILANFTDKIVCISDAEKHSALRRKIAKEDKLRLIINGVNLIDIYNTIPEKRNVLNIPEDAFVIGMVGRLAPQKAPDIFIQSADLILKEIPNAYFMIVGDGEMREEIEAFSIERGVPLYVTGWTDDPYKYLKVFDMAILLSRWEGFGLAIVEYMAAGKNFITTRVDAIPTIVEDGIDGILVDIDSPIQVKEKVLFLYHHKKVAEKMKKNALEKVSIYYDIHRVAEQHIEMFNELLRTK